jgi:BirA family transcriptional regulator, biotin operon repressor / biotin---[acetyl-CoA-carboxylase] ligase
LLPFGCSYKPKALLKILEQTDSTNNYAMRLIHEGAAKHGMAVAALLQTAGKGQRGKSWQMQAGKNIALSVIIKTDALKPAQQFLLSMAVAMAGHDFIKKYVPDDVSVKWPNDLYWRTSKAGGILIENVFSGSKWKWAVAGVGINVNQISFNKSLPNPVSLKQITERHFDIEKVTAELYEKILQRIDKLYEQPHDKLLKEFNRRLFCCNKEVKLKKGSLTFKTVVTGVSIHGQLHTKDAIERSFDFGEVEWML